MIGDPIGANQQFDDQTIQDRLDEHRTDVRYEPLEIAPSIVNTPSTGNTPVTIFADYYSRYGWWEQDIVLQANNTTTGAAWVVVTPVSSDYIVGHWTFENNVFTSGTVPGQYPPVFATGKIFDNNRTAADLLRYWAATLAGAYDVTVDGQSLRRSQLMTAKLALAEYYLREAKPTVAKMNRGDVMPSISSRHMRLLDSDDLVRGA